jgi:hypothetical protein
MDIKEAMLTARVNAGSAHAALRTHSHEHGFAWSINQSHQYNMGSIFWRDYFS